MIKGLKICGVSDPKTLNYILDHRHTPSMIGFITNYERSRRFIEYDKLQRLIYIDKKNVNFVSVLVSPNEEILEKIWGYDVYIKTRTIDNVILSLRKIFEREVAPNTFFKSVRGVGYKLTI